MRTTHRFASWGLGLVLAVGALTACFVDPNPPNPHGDGGDDPPGDQPNDLLPDSVDGGAEAGP